MDSPRLRLRAALCRAARHALHTVIALGATLTIAVTFTVAAFAATSVTDLKPGDKVLNGFGTPCRVEKVEGPRAFIKPLTTGRFLDNLLPQEGYWTKCNLLQKADARKSSGDAQAADEAELLKTLARYDAPVLGQSRAATSAAEGPGASAPADVRPADAAE